MVPTVKKKSTPEVVFVLVLIMTTPYHIRKIHYLFINRSRNKVIHVIACSRFKLKKYHEQITMNNIGKNL